MPAINIVFHGEKTWIFIAESDYRRLENKLKRNVLGENLYLSTDYLDSKGIPYEKVTVKAGQGLFVPSGVLHSVQNSDDTIAVAFNLMLPETLPVAWDVLDRNQSLSALLERDLSKVCLEQLIFRAGYHVGKDTEAAQELRQSLSIERYRDLKVVLRRLLRAIKEKQSASFSCARSKAVSTAHHRVVGILFLHCCSFI